MDTVADMLVRIKNAQSTKKDEVTITNSKLNRHICEVLIEEGFLDSFKVVNKVVKKIKTAHPAIIVKLRYHEGQPVIRTIKRLSRPSLRVYSSAAEIPTVVDGFGSIIVSTSKGIMSHLKAKQANLGGELLFLIN